MATTDVVLDELIINELSKEQYDSLETKDPNQLYLTPDTSLETIAHDTSLEGTGREDDPLKVSSTITNDVSTIKGNYITKTTDETITGNKTFESTNGTVIKRTTTNGPILQLESAQSTTYFSLKRTNAAECVLEADQGAGLFGTKSNHPLQIRAGYTTQATVGTNGSFVLAQDVATESNDNQVATTKWVNSKIATSGGTIATALALEEPTEADYNKIVQYMGETGEIDINICIDGEVVKGCLYRCQVYNVAIDSDTTVPIWFWKSIELPPMPDDGKEYILYGDGVNYTWKESDALSEVAHDTTLTGKGTTAEPLSVTPPTVQVMTESNIEVTLANNTIYYANNPESVTINLPMELPGNEAYTFICEFTIDAGNNTPAFTAPNNILWSGDDIVDNSFVPAANKNYTIMFYSNGYWNAVVRGVQYGL